MNNQIGETLKAYIQQKKMVIDRGPFPTQLKGWLMDMHPQSNGEINVIMKVWEAGIVQRIANEAVGLIDLQIKNYALQIQNNYFIDPRASVWAVKCWFYALGKISALDGSSETVAKQQENQPQPNQLRVSRVGNQRIIHLTDQIGLPVIRIPAGKFLMGSNSEDNNASSDEKPQHEVLLDEYWIGKHPITNLQWRVFMREAGGNAPGHWGGSKIPDGLEHHPVVCVSWQDANAFCEWLSAGISALARLPNEAEWEKAARGVDGRIWPWGSKKPGKWAWPLGNGRLCNFSNIEGTTSPVGKYSPQGDSPYGCTDMSGNVSEWTNSLLRLYPFKTAVIKADQDNSSPYILRGGAYNSDESETRCAYRGSRHFDATTGFRICILKEQISIAAPITEVNNIYTQRESKEKAEREAEEKAKQEAEEKIRKEAAEKARREAEEKARREAEEKARREEVEKAKQREAEEKIGREAAEKAKREAEEKARREAEEKARREEAEKAKQREAEEKIRREAAEKAKREAEEKARREAKEKARREEAERAKQREAEEKIRREAAEKAKREAEEKARQEAEEKARREEAEKKAVLEAEMRAMLEARRKARLEAQEKARLEAQEKARLEAQEKARLEAQENARRLEAEKKAKQEAERKARLEAEEKAKRKAHEVAILRARQEGKRREEFLKDPIMVPMEFVNIPYGNFIMGSCDLDLEALSNEKPQRSVTLAEYWIGAFPVTNRQWEPFVKFGAGPLPTHWITGGIPHGLEDHPVVNISWEDAHKFCEWLSSSNEKREFRLPSEAEWEKAARGQDGRLFPWGDERPDAQKCNFNNHIGTTTPVGAFCLCSDSPYGCSDMAGNVMEWALDWCIVENQQVIIDLSKGPKKGRAIWKILRGGSWKHDSNYSRCANRFYALPTHTADTIGFRCVMIKK